MKNKSILIVNILIFILLNQVAFNPIAFHNIFLYYARIVYFSCNGTLILLLLFQYIFVKKRPPSLRILRILMLTALTFFVINIVPRFFSFNVILGIALTISKYVIFVLVGIIICKETMLPRKNFSFPLASIIAFALFITFYVVGVIIQDNRMNSFHYDEETTIFMFLSFLVPGFYEILFGNMSISFLNYGLMFFINKNRLKEE